MATESDTMAVLAAVLADPAAAAQRLKDLNAAKSAAEYAQLELDKRIKQAEKSEADANAKFKEASEMQLAAGRALKKAEDERKNTQLLLDKIGIREAETSAREEAVLNKETAQKATETQQQLTAKALDERTFNIGAKEKEYTVKLGELDRKLKIIKGLAA